MEPITETTNSEEGVSTKTLLPYDESLAAFFKDLGISDFEQPFFIAVDGVRYTFESAKFEDGQILINTRFEKNNFLSVIHSRGNYFIFFNV